MNALTIIYVVLSYGAALIFLGGVAFKVYQYARTPSPLTIPTTPAPTSASGVVARMAREIFFFESLFKGEKFTWVGGYLLHLALAAILVRHARYFMEPTPTLIETLNPIGILAGVLALVAAGYLYARRLFTERLRYISLSSDYFALALIGLIALTGLMLKFLFRTDIVAVKGFILGVVFFEFQPMPSDILFLLHYTLALVLFVYFPFSKLLHAPGVFFTPTRTQPDNPREKRRVNPWAAHRPEPSGARTGGGD